VLRRTLVRFCGLLPKTLICPSDAATSFAEAKSAVSMGNGWTASKSRREVAPAQIEARGMLGLWSAFPPLASELSKRQGPSSLWASSSAVRLGRASLRRPSEASAALAGTAAPSEGGFTTVPAWTREAIATATTVAAARVCCGYLSRTISRIAAATRAEAKRKSTVCSSSDGPGSVTQTCRRWSPNHDGKGDAFSLRSTQSNKRRTAAATGAKRSSVPLRGNPRCARSTSCPGRPWRS